MATEPPKMQKYMTNSFSGRAITTTTGNKPTHVKPTHGPAVSTKKDTSRRVTSRDTKETNKPNILVIVTAVSTVVAIVSMVIMFAVIFAIPKKTCESSTTPSSSPSAIVQRVDSCQGERRLMFELGDLCHDVRSHNGPVLKCNVVGRNAIIQGDALIGNAYKYGTSWQVLTVFRPCDGERKEPVIFVSVLTGGKLTHVKADEQSSSGVNKSYMIPFENRHYGVAGDTKKNLSAYVDASFFSTSQNGATEMHLLVVLKQDCWSGATREQCDPAPIVIKNQVCQARCSTTFGIRN